MGGGEPAGPRAARGAGAPELGLATGEDRATVDGALAGIEHEDWSLVSFARRVSNWPLRLWDFTKPYQFIGGPGGDGVGYTAPAAAGAALANRKHGRLSISIQPDGDLLMSSSILWTLAHHRIPLLMVMHNNRSYYQEHLHLRRMNRRHGAGSPAKDIEAADGPRGTAQLPGLPLSAHRTRQSPSVHRGGR